MFGRTNSPDATDETQTQQTETASMTTATPRATVAETTARTLSPAVGPMSSRRGVDLPQGRRGTPERDRNGEASGSKLIVGRGLSISGEITDCDILVVEGKVEAKLSDGKLLEITESGQFRGNVEIENADIAGRYDGDLTVHGRLTIRGTGRISGVVKYGELEVNAGGQVIGEMQVVGGGAMTGATKGPNFKTAAKFTATTTDDEEEPLFSRKTASNG